MSLRYSVGFRWLIAKMLAIALLLATALPAFADRHDWGDRGGDRGGNRGGEWSGQDGRWQGFREHRDIRHFDSHDFSVWRSGEWRHERHDGRLGWWWVTAGIWYFYPWPAYPYPDPYIPPVVVTTPQPQELAPPPAQNWYFCTSANGYYPYIASCPEGWKAVPATPPAVPAQ